MIDSRDMAGIFRAIETIYETSVAERPFEPMLSEICALADLDRGGVLSVGPAGAPTRWDGAHNIKAEAIRPYELHFSQINPYRGLMPKPTLSYYEMASEYSREPTIRSSEFFNDFTKPCGLEYSNVMALNIKNDIIRFATFGRDTKRGDLTSHDHELFACLLPHLQRSFLIRGSAADLRDERDAAVDALNRMSTGVIFIDADRKILRMNAEARRLCTRSNGLLARQQRLSAVSRAVDKLLQQSLGATLDTAAGINPQAGAVVAIPRPLPDRPLSVICMPVTDRSSVHTARMMVLLRDPDRSIQAASEALKVVFGLSPTETRIAAMIADGKTLQDAAKSIGHAINTSRYMLKRVFRKTATSSQSELAALVGKISID